MCFHLAKNILPTPRAQTLGQENLTRLFVYTQGAHDSWNFGRSNGHSKMKAFSNEKGQLTLAHTSNFSFRPFEWQDNIKEGLTTRYIKKWKGCNNGGLDIWHAIVWTFNYLTTTQNEGGKTYLNQTNPFHKWNSREFWMLLVQTSTFRTKH
jgi:hypothetical protein